MLYFIIILIFFIKSPCITASNSGTTLFYKKNPISGCWTEDEFSKLRARKMFEQLIPPPVTPEKVNKRFIKDTLKYFRSALNFVEQDSDNHTAEILKEALADTIGGHLRYVLLPTVRFAYYAGYVPYKHVRQIHDFFDDIKCYLNTRGLGWKEPKRIPQWSNLTVVKILIGPGKLFDPCVSLTIKRDANSCVHLPSPKLDNSRNPSAIALPFKFGSLISLMSPDAENILLKYYTTASRCILRRSPDSCRHTDFVTFNNELWHWMKRDVAPHLLDEKLCAGYGGVLRIAAAVQNYGKGLSRRNMFSDNDEGVTKWHPWKTLTESYIFINTDWGPKLYIGIVLMVALAICLLQICYNYMFSDLNCNCAGPNWPKKDSKTTEYANVDSNIPALFPIHQSAVYYSDKKRSKQNSQSKTKTSSLGSMRTQKVYDLNENTEKLMAVIMSANETSEDDLSPSKHTDSEEESENKHVPGVGQTPRRPKSPPKIETPICELKIDKTPRGNNRNPVQMYSTSNVSHSEFTYGQEQVSDSAWSGAPSSTSVQSVSSTSSKSRGRRSSRDLAWARRIVSKHTVRHIKSVSETELDINSFTTPPS